MGDDLARALEVGDSSLAEVDEEDFEAQDDDDEKKPWSSKLEDFLECENVADFVELFLDFLKNHDDEEWLFLMIIWFCWWSLDIELGFFFNLREEDSNGMDACTFSSGGSLGIPGWSSHWNGTVPGNLQ